jgi:hypothetical protein
MVLPDWLRPPRPLLAIFVAATVLPALAFGWLAWIGLAELDRQQARGALDAAAGRVVSDLRQRLDGTVRELPALVRAAETALPHDSVLLIVTADGVEERPLGRLLYHPHAPGGSLARTAALDAAAALEGRRDYRAAAAAFRRAASPDGTTIAVTVQRPDRTIQLGLVTAADGTLRILKSLEWRGSTGVEFSPDGRYLLYDAPASDRGTGCRASRLRHGGGMVA